MILKLDMEIKMSRIISYEERANRAIELVEILVSKGKISRDQMTSQVKLFMMAKTADAWADLECSFAD